MSQQWAALVRQLCTPLQQRVVSAIAEARRAPLATESTSADVAQLARRFGLSSGDADVWSRGPVALTVLAWPRQALDMIEPSGLFEEIGLDDTVAVLDRLSRIVADEADGRVDSREPALV